MTTQTTPDPDPVSVLLAVETLSIHVGGLSQSVSTLAKTTRSNRHLIRIIAVSLIFDICLSLGLGLATYEANRAIHRANEARRGLVVAQKALAAAQAATATAQAVAADSAHKTCVSANEARTVASGLWNFVLNSVSARTPEGQAQIALLKAKVAQAYKQHVC